MVLNFLKNGKGELLNFFFKNPDQEYYLAQVAKALNKENSYYVRHLANLVEEQILIEHRKGKMRFFKLNTGHPLYAELKSIVSKTRGADFVINESLNGLAGIEAAFIFGSIAKNQENILSDIDLMLIGKTDQDLLAKAIASAENELGREINYHLYGKEEFKQALADKNTFITAVLNGPIRIIKGKLNGIAGIDQ